MLPEVPEHLKGKFAEMPPVFKNIDVSRDDIGRPHEDVCRRTRDHEPEEQVSDWKYVWPEDHGYFSSVEVVEYTPATCFQRFGEQVSDARRAGDVDPNKKIVAETKKLEGNASYGKTVTNKERHTDVLYCQEQQVSRHLVDPSFGMSKKTIRLALSAETLEEVIKPDLRQVYDIEKKNWFPRTDTP